MDYITEKTTPTSEKCSFWVDMAVTMDPQSAISVQVKVTYMSNIVQLSNEGLSFEGLVQYNTKNEKVIMCTFSDYQGIATLAVCCADDVYNVPLIEAALDYIGAGNLKYAVSDRYIESLV